MTDANNMLAPIMKKITDIQPIQGVTLATPVDGRLYCRERVFDNAKEIAEVFKGKIVICRLISAETRKNLRGRPTFEATPCRKCGGKIIVIRTHTVQNEIRRYLKCTKCGAHSMNAIKKGTPCA
jgi:hypothetical protein